MWKLKFMKSKLKHWNKVSFKDLRERRSSIILGIGRIDLFEQEGNLNHDLFAMRILRRRELEKLMLKE